MLLIDISLCFVIAIVKVFLNVDVQPFTFTRFFQHSISTSRPICSTFSENVIYKGMQSIILSRALLLNHGQRSRLYVLFHPIDKV